MFVAMPSRLLNSCLSHKCRDIVAACSRFWQIFLLVLSTTISSGCQKSEDLANSVGSPTHEGVFQDDTVPEQSLHAAVQLRDANADDWFEDVTKSSGLKFVHSSGRRANAFTMVETFGAGVAIFDFDNDGDMDILCAGGGQISKELKFTGSLNRLFRNDGDLTFTDVTANSGLEAEIDYTHGVTAGDINNDGLLDVFFSCFGRSRLFQNMGNGRFEDRTPAMKPELEGWHTACCFADVTDDGRADLFVTGYLQWQPDSKERCLDPKSGRRDVCMPGIFPGAQDHLYVATPDGQFLDASKTAGLLPDGKGLGVVALDFDGNGKLDFYVANDVVRNHLYLGQGNGVFVESAVPCGVAGNEFGAPEGSMGVDAADYDNDGNLDIFVTNYEFEDNSLYRGIGNGLFSHSTVSSGLGGICRPYVGFGTEFFDADLDGWLDLVVINGHVTYRNRQSPYEQPAFLFKNVNGTRFSNVTENAGPWFSVPHAGRGVSVADLNNDGAPDLVITEQDGPVSLLRNRNTATNWLGLHLKGTRSGTDAIGSRVRLLEPASTVVQHLKSGGSYLCCSDPRRRFYFSDSSLTSAAAEVIWPDGKVEQFSGLDVRRYHTIEQGTGLTLEASP
jgi:hypothetical protein